LLCIHPSFVSCPDIFLKEASLPKKIALDKSSSRQQKKSFLHQQLVTIQYELSDLQRDVSDLAVYNPARNGVTSELDNNDQHEVENLIQPI